MKLKIKYRYLLTICLASLVAGTSGAAELTRSSQDEARDAHSRPFQVLAFLGVQPGWTVIDMFGASGYYAEVLSQAVGPAGTVYLHNNQAYMGFARGLAARVQNNRLPNLIPYQREIRDIDLPSNSVDMALMVMSYHDVYFEQNGWDVRVQPTLEALHRILRPGGVLAIIDHHAKPGSGHTAVQALHRIDAGFARQDIERFGFSLQAASDLLENPADDLTRSVFDPAIKGKTSKFLYRFVKTE